MWIIVVLNFWRTLEIIITWSTFVKYGTSLANVAYACSTWCFGPCPIDQSRDYISRAIHNNLKYLQNITWYCNQLAHVKGPLNEFLKECMVNIDLLPVSVVEEPKILIYIYIKFAPLAHKLHSLVRVCT